MKLLLGAGLILIMVTIGGIIAYAALTAQDKAQNDFRFGDFKTTIEETFTPPKKLEKDKAVEKKVSITNEGEQDSFIRVLLLPTFEATDATGNVLLLEATTTGDTPDLNLKTNTTDWTLGEDGYYYYLKKVAKGKSTSPVLEEVTVLGSGVTNEYDQAELNVEVKVEGISTTKWAYRDAFWQGAIPTDSNLAAIDQVLQGLAQSVELP